jgi:AraC-like DNA-binding protein
LIKEINPGVSLAEYVRLYRIIDFNFPDDISMPAKVYPPRPEQCIQFYPRDTETVLYPDSNLTISNKKTTVTGQHTIINHRYIGNKFLTVQVVFQPGALFCITGIPMNELANKYMDAEAIFGTDIHLVTEQLYFAGSHNEMIGIVETYLAGLIKGKRRIRDNIHFVGNLMLSDEHYNLDKFIKIACLSHRQFDRKFKDRIGITPKQFLQIIRFEKAFSMKNNRKEKDWLSIALHCGYHDYQHLVKDFKEFTGGTPNQFFEIENNAPERFMQRR